MTKERRTEGMNLSFEGMSWAQSLMDTATCQRDQRIARAMYESFWCLWTVLTDKRENHEPTKEKGADVLRDERRAAADNGGDP